MNPIFFRFIKLCYILISIFLFITAMVFLVQALHDQFIVRITYWHVLPPKDLIPFDEMVSDESLMWGYHDAWGMFFTFLGVGAVFQVVVTLVNWVLTGKLQSPKVIFYKEKGKIL